MTASVVDGEVVAVLPPDVESKVVSLRTLDGASQALAVTAMLSHARTGLLAAIAAQDLPQIVEWKAKGAAVQEIAKQLRLGKDMQLDAAEFVRRAERGLGVAIREGQERGEVLSRGEKLNPGANQHQPGPVLEQESTKIRPTELAPKSELHGTRGDTGIYAMTDNVSDEVFEEAIAEAREEQNLSRANVARKSKAKAGKATPKPAATEPKKVRKTAAARKVIEDLVVTVNSLVFVINDTDPEEVDYQKHKEDIAEIWQGTNTIRRFLKLIEEEN